MDINTKFRNTIIKRNALLSILVVALILVSRLAPSDELEFATFAVLITLAIILSLFAFSDFSSGSRYKKKYLKMVAADKYLDNYNNELNESSKKYGRITVTANYINTNVYGIGIYAFSDIKNICYKKAKSSERRTDIYSSSPHCIQIIFNNGGKLLVFGLKKPLIDLVEDIKVSHPSLVD